MLADDDDLFLSVEPVPLLGEWPEEPVECPSCPHTDLDHDETGCTVDGCECTGP